MFGRREKCEECSEYSNEEENPNLNKEEGLTVREAAQELIEKLEKEYLEDKGQSPKDID
jgi:hypothetical protein